MLWAAVQVREEMCDANSIEATPFLSAAAICASFLPLATSCFNFETDILVFFIFFADSFSPTLISCFLSTARPVAVSVKFPSDKKPSCRWRLLYVDEVATLHSVLRVALEDNESLNSTFRILTPETWRSTSRRRRVQCFSPSHRGTWSSGARAEEAPDSELELVTRTSCSMWSNVQHTRSAWATLATAFFW